MSALVVLAVLGSALLHGTWNAIAKSLPSPLASSTLMGIVYLCAGGIGCLLMPVPDPAAWPFLTASALAQTLYLLLLTAAYARTEFGRAYPLARGASVLGVTAAAAVLFGERLTPLQLAGVAIVTGSLFALSVTKGALRDLASTGLILAVGATVTVYSVIDGAGVRLSGHALSYAAWLFLLQGVTIPLACLVLARDRRALLHDVRTLAPRGVAGGVVSLVAYTIVVWAQSVAPLAVVSALRETSVLVAGVIGWVFFREPLRAWRIVASVAAAAGIALVRLGA
ncbi:EamA family transporter [Microbacterium azadirachtae]|uniref:EamA-like transporter family protein n=1 Tax=Microbacterium azadirachtae TaxID=582680 RepID=A0A0F0LPM2_9MICO|nr:EamA family transporter [Microbacterium azadirachtae]KJL33486.1 EamA-like transporter family protein [Microbacterium azadirachtae]